MFLDCLPSWKFKNKLKQLEEENLRLKLNSNNLISLLLKEIENYKRDIKILKNENIKYRKFYETKTRIPPYPPYIIDKLKDLYLNKNIEYECPICFIIIDTSNIELSSCGHFYCNKCIKEIKNCLTCHYKFTNDEKYKFIANL